MKRKGNEGVREKGEREERVKRKEKRDGGERRRKREGGKVRVKIGEGIGEKYTQELEHNTFLP